MKKRQLIGYFCLTFILFSFVLMPSVRAEDPVPFANETEAVRGFVEQNKWDYIGEQWQKLLLENYDIARVDSFLHKLDFVFSIFLGRAYSLSIAFFFALVLWIITLVALMRYTHLFVNPWWQRTGIALIGVIILAQINLFNVVALGLVKVIFYKVSFVWSLVTMLACLVLLFIYSYINKLLAYKFEKAREAQKKHELEHKVDVIAEQEKATTKVLKD